MLLTALFLAALFVAYSNGANDNFKGVASLYASNTTNFKSALRLGTVATLAGSVSSVFLAAELVHAFSGKGLVPDSISASPDFLLAVAIGAASTVMLASVLGFPISTTHALTGALVGAGYMAAGSDLNLSVIGSVFFLPLLVSPLLSIVLTMPLYEIAHAATQWLRLDKATCICVGPREFVPTRALAFDCSTGNYLKQHPVTGADLMIGSIDDCVDKYRGKVLGISAQGLVDAVHYLSAATVSFARGLNDTPKIVGLLVVVEALNIQISMLAIALTMAFGGLINARRVAETMSKKITKMNDGQALTANLVTAFMVIGASRLGVPVSTTHVSVGAISGIGIVNGTGNVSMMSVILLTWALTLPIAAALAALGYALLS